MDNRLYIDSTGPLRETDGYDALLSSIRQSFEQAVKDGAAPLFTTDAADLYALFLENIPEEARQCYDCSTCRHFVNRSGRLVSVNPASGELNAVMWGGPIPEFFRQAVAAVKARVEAAHITGVFVTDKTELGCARTGIWTHMAVDVPWSDRPCGFATKGALFVLKGARDLDGPSSACLFPSILKGELYEVRATIEAYSNRTKPVGKETADACGLLIQSSSKTLAVKLRVTTDVGVALYKIDRWD